MSINLGFITVAPCANTVPPPDSRCSDPAFALANPDICSAPQPTLVIKPGMAIACTLGSVQFKAFLQDTTGETDVTTDTVFSSSDPTIAVVGATSGNCTGVGSGEAQISASYQTYTAFASITVMAGSDCCSSRTVAFLLLVDVTKSMSASFDANYSTRLKFAAAAARQFITKVRRKDRVGLTTFTGVSSTFLAPIGTQAAALAAIPSIAQTQDTTGFTSAITQAVSDLNNSVSDQRVLVIISDGEDETSAESADAGVDPITTADNFKQAGGIVICLGVRASGTANGYALLSELATGGFFLNALPANETTILDYLTGLMGYMCAGDCTPEGDVIVGQGELNFTAFQNWSVTGGRVDLLGNGFFDVLPGNGLYVNLAGTSAPHDGVMTSKSAFPIVSGHDYRLSVKLAGNQVNPDSGAAVQVSVVGASSDLLQSIVLSDYTSGFHTYNYTFTATATDSAHIVIQQNDTGTPPDPQWGCLLKEVTLTDVTDDVTLFDDTFSGDNLVYVPPRCGTGTTYIQGYGYYTGSDCAYQDTCLSTPPPSQAADPNAIADIESSGGGTTGPSGPPATCGPTSQTYTATCPAGQTQLNPTPITAKASSTGNNIQAALNGLVWALPHAAFETDPTDQVENIGGDPGTLYTANLLIRGSVELKGYGAQPPNTPGGVTIAPIAGTGGIAALATLNTGNSFPNGELLATDPQNEYLLIISNPPQIIALNNSPSNTSLAGQNNVQVVRYPLAVQMYGGATVTLTARTIDGKDWGGINPVPRQTQDPPFILIQNPFFNSPTGGQWLQMDVLSVLGGTGAQTFPYKYTLTLAAAATAAYYSITNSTLAANSPTDWTLQGSNDGSTWTLIDARAGMSLSAAATYRFPIETPAAYIYYQVVFTATSNSLFPTLSGVSVYPAAVPAVGNGSASGVSPDCGTGAALAAAKLQANAALAGQCFPLFTAQETYTANCAVGSGSAVGSGTAQSYNSQAEANAAALAIAKQSALAALVCGANNNSAVVSVNNLDRLDGPFSPYPSLAVIADPGFVIGPTHGIKVTLKGFNNVYASDVGIVLMGPDGTCATLMANCWGSRNVAAVDVVVCEYTGILMPFGSTASPTIPTPGQKYLPTAGWAGNVSVWNAASWAMASGKTGPTDPLPCDLTVFNGKNPAGNWQLFMAHFINEPPVGGSISGWTIEFTDTQ